MTAFEVHMTLTGEAKEAADKISNRAHAIELMVVALAEERREALSRLWRCIGEIAEKENHPLDKLREYSYANGIVRDLGPSDPDSDGFFDV